MAGVLGTALMLVECSRVGARIALDAIPRPLGVDFDRWLTAFPSYGFLMAVRPAHADTVMERFATRGLACAVIGDIDATREVVVEEAGETALLWDFRIAPFIAGASGGAR